jgi:uncharacterized protein (DUF1330 family)
MGKSVTFLCGIVAGLLLSGVVVTGIANTEVKKAYLVVSGQVINDEGMEAYREKAGPVARAAGINIVARNETVTPELLLEGDWPHEGFVVIEEFSSMSALKNFWFSPDYQDAIKLREGKVKLDFVIAVQGQ